MAEEEKDKEAPEKDKAEKEAPSAPEDGQAEEQDAPEKEASVPEKLEGKSAEDLVKMYGELERKLGKQSTEVSEARKLKQDMAVVLEAIYSDPEVKKKVESSIREKLGMSDDTKDTDTKDDKKDGEADVTAREIRQLEESRIIREFEKERGLSSLPDDERKDVYKKIGSELADMLDPGGNKPINEVINKVNLSKLPSMLDKAYKLANQDGEVEKAIKKGMVKQRETQEATIGSIPSVGGNSESVSLTADERKTAKSLGISEKKYLENKKHILKAKGLIQ